MKRTPLTPEQAEWLARTLDRNRSEFGGWTMKADDGSDADDTDDDKSDDSDDSDDDGDSDDDSDDDDLAPEDNPNDIAYWKKRSRQNEREARKYRREAERATKNPAAAKSDKKGGKADDDKGDQPDVETIRQEAREEAVREALHGRIEDKIEAKARAFADPEDAVAVLLRAHEYDDFVDADGKVDADEIAEALKDLGEKKPHLLAQGGKRFQGGADGGTRKEKPARAKSLGEAIARHYDKS